MLLLLYGSTANGQAFVAKTTPVGHRVCKVCGKSLFADVLLTFLLGTVWQGLLVWLNGLSQSRRSTRHEFGVRFSLTGAFPASQTVAQCFYVGLRFL